MKRTTKTRPSAIRCAAQGVCEVDYIDSAAVAAARAAIADAGPIDEFADRLGVLANPARLRLLVALAQQELCVCDCAQVIGQSLSAASQHLKELRRIGAVQFRQDGRLAYYRLTDSRWLRQVRTLLTDLPRAQEARS